MIEKIQCEECQHYRPQTSFIDAYKQFDQSSPRGPIMKSLLEVRKEETKALEGEVELQLELLRTRESAWPSTPRFAPLCVASGGEFAPAVKNADGRCGDFKLAIDREGKGCRTCRFVVRPHTRIGERSGAMESWMNSQAMQFQKQINKEQEDADATSQAVEIEQSFYGNGRLRTAAFLPTCDVQITQGERHVVPFCNLRRDCREHMPFFRIPRQVFDVVRAQAAPTDRSSLEHTIELAKLIAGAGADRPVAFLESLVAWLKKDVRRAAVGPCVKALIGPRWSRELQNASERNTFEASLKQFEGGAKAVLVPVVAGCDAYEWGLLAALSRSGDGGAIASANVACQQIAEFVAAMLSPVASAHAIDAAIALIRAPGLFADLALERADAFLRRLATKSGELHLIAREDLVSCFEDFVARISYVSGHWLRLDPKDAERIAIMNAQLAEQARQNMAAKIEYARQQAAALVSVAVGLEARMLTNEQRTQALNNLLQDNEVSVARDVEDSRQMVEALMAQMSQRVGLMDDGTAGFAIRQVHQQQYQMNRAQELPMRKVFATMAIYRGAFPVTPTALDLFEREPRIEEIPETLEQALRDPHAKTLEAFHAARFKGGDDADAAILRGTLYRRIPAPYLEAAMPATATTSVEK